MWRRLSPAAGCLVFGLTLPAIAAETDSPAETLFGEHCAACHGADRLGGTGPALLPESLARLRPERARSVIAEGRAATQMPAFGDVLAGDDIDALVSFVYTPLPEPPGWDLADMRGSHILAPGDEPLPVAPVYDADPLHLFVVVESGDHHVSILDGDRLEPIHRFPSRFALHGGPKFSPDGRFVYFASRDGWITKYDLYGLQVVAEIRAGINTRNIALSHDGAVVAVANYLPHTLVMLDATDLSPLTVIPTKGMRNGPTSRVSAVYQAAPRESFIVAFKDIREVWEIPYGTSPRPVFSGLVHNYEPGREEALAQAAERFPIRRIEVEAPLDDFFFGPGYRVLIGASREGGASVVHLDVGRTIAHLPIDGLPHLGSGITWRMGDRTVMATPHLRADAVSVIDMENWEVVRRIETLGPGFFMRSHRNSPYAWVDVFFGPNSDALHVIDKQSLEIVATLRPDPGKTAAHVEFTHDGRYALVSIWDMEGAIAVYDAVTLEEVARIPMVRPSGKYNVFNKITLEEGTSH
ncbi:MAG: cytochrome C oxidase Cbb3 [Inquilinus sp.]|nr:cytochrome C oxidase Cbb3 [Inquilinus sp.]